MNTQQLKNKVESLEAELQAFKEQLDEQLKTNEFEIDYQEIKDMVTYRVNDYGEVRSLIYSDVEYNKDSKFGLIRKTKELAEVARDNMRARNKLEELAHWLDPDWKPDWSNRSQRKYYIGYNCDFKRFYNSSVSYFNLIGTVYMSEQTADKICNALNDGLLPELAEILKGVKE